MVEIDIHPDGHELVCVRRGVAVMPTLVVVLGLSAIAGVQVVAWHFLVGVPLKTLLPVFAVVVVTLTGLIWFARYHTQMGHAGTPVLIGAPGGASPRWSVWDERAHELVECDAVVDVRLERVRDPRTTGHRVFTHVNALVAVCKDGDKEPRDVVVALQPWTAGLSREVDRLRRRLGAENGRAAPSTLRPMSSAIRARTDGGDGSELGWPGHARALVAACPHSGQGASVTRPARG
ncbi:MAG TPA: hypothetical protein VFF65_10120 [Phycisphaerales bacterium]|nr:hypothetical protein [Phycisphaerales bacterium]